MQKLWILKFEQMARIKINYIIILAFIVTKYPHKWDSPTIWKNFKNLPFRT